MRQSNYRQLLALVFAALAISAVSACSTWTCHKDAAVPMPAPPPPPPPPPAPVACQSITIDHLTDEHTFTDGSTDAAKTLAACLVNSPSTKISVDGHADYRGTKTYNQGLSQRRANAVADFLVANGVNAANITINAYGETKPVAMGKDPASLAINRQTVVTVLQ